MVKLTQSLYEFLWRFHWDILSPLLFGHTELFTAEMKNEYIAWCKTEEGRQYLEGGSKYREDYAQ